jgi:4'-phosphopantetheinyl transferase
VNLDRGAYVVARLRMVLDEEERERADRYVFARDQQRFTCARGALRGLMGAYLGIDAADVVFAYGEHGKPALGGAHAGALAFNLSHSGEWALVAVADGGELGVDIEAVRPMTDRHEIALRFFAPAEAALLRSLPEPEQDPAFFRCWTRKEAYLKALGDGLARPLDSFEVAFAAGDEPRLRVVADERELARWRVVPIEAPEGYAAALVVDRPVTSLQLRNWSE